MVLGQCLLPFNILSNGQITLVGILTEGVGESNAPIPLYLITNLVPEVESEESRRELPSYLGPLDIFLSHQAIF